MSITGQVDEENNMVTLPDLEAVAPTFQVDGGGDGAILPRELDPTTVGRLLLSFVPGAPLSREQLLSSLFWISCLTLMLGMSVVFYVPATGPVFGRYPAAYYTMIAIVLGAAAVELAAAYWLSCSNGPGALGFAKLMMHSAYPVFLLVLSMSGFGILLAKVYTEL